MPNTFSEIIQVFIRGLGLRISLSFLPPIIVAWTFFLLYLNELSGRQSQHLWMAAALGLLGIAIGSVVVLRLILTTIPPIRHLIHITSELARGNYALDIPNRTQTDETGELARALDVFRLQMIELEGVAAIKSEKESDLIKKRELLSLADALEGEVEGTIKHVMTQAETMSASTGETAQAIRRMEGLYKTLTTASDETLINVNAVAAATEELAAASREIASQMARTIAITSDAVGKAEEADGTMRELAEVSTRIGEVLEIIRDIASLTNLLSLNATIEAARAGEAGKGFAVVAAEVKGLAGQTAKAVSTIAEQVEGIRGATANGVTAISAVVQAITEVNNVATAVAAAVEEQEASTREISSNAQDAATQAQRVSTDAASISTEVEQVDHLAVSVEQGAHDVTSHLDKMEQRLSGILVHTVGNTKTGAGHSGQALPGFVHRGGQHLACHFEQMEIEGARLVGVSAAVGDQLDLTLTDFGALKATVVHSDATGLKLDFLQDSVTKARLGEYLFGHYAIDQFYIKLAKETAHQVEQAFEAELTKGSMTLDDLFDRDYRPIANTNPQQVTTRFLEMAERVLPPIQEATLQKDAKIVFGLAVNQDGYVSAHMASCSKPQGPDPVWNFANCRNRRIFNNRAELASVTHTKDHLLQTYIRDMGGGNVSLLKDASVPICIRGRHWGGFRLGYKL